MRWLLAGLVIIFISLQARLWVGEGSLAEISRLERKIKQQEQRNTLHRERNRLLELEIAHLKNGLNGIEELARQDMGMIKPGETFYLVVDSKPAP